jgi:hypothetical protein
MTLLGTGYHVTGDVTTELDRPLLASCVSYELTRRLLQVPAYRGSCSDVGGNIT